VKVILCGCSVIVGEDMAIWSIHPPGAWDGIALLFEFETWLLPKGRHKEGEGDIIDGYFCMAPSPKVWR
jgi:hypothetical protein